MIELNFIQSDYTPPNGASIPLDFVPVQLDIVRLTQGAVIRESYVTYRLSFVNDIYFPSLNPVDFGNAGFAPIRVTEIKQITSKIFDVTVYVLSGGTLQFQINEGASIDKLPSGQIDTTSAIKNDEIINVPLDSYPLDARLTAIAVAKTIVRSN